MSEEQRRQLDAQLWGIANLLRGKVDPDDYRDYILDDLQSFRNHIEQSTAGIESEDDFNALFEDLDLNSTKLDRTPNARNEIIVNTLTYLDEIDFRLDEVESDVIGDAY